MNRPTMEKALQHPPFSPRRTLLSVLVPLAFAPVTMLAHAQAQAPDATTPAATPAVASQPEAEASVVTVTANRRREPAREVPMQVNMVSTEKLEQGGAGSLADYIADQPGIDVNSGGGPGRGSVTMRGVSTGDQVIAVVGMYIDDVAVGSSSAYARGAMSALDMALLDLHHIEVLRGPQGTLYGAGAMGGLLKYVTNEPDTNSFYGKINLGASQTHRGEAGGTLSGVVNVPLSEGVAGVRVSAFHDKAAGYTDARGGLAGRDVNGGASNGARISVLLDPSANLRVRLTGTAQDIRRDGLDLTDYSPTTGQPLTGELTQTLATGQPYRSRVRLVSADLEYEMGWARLNSITSLQTTHLTTFNDYSSAYVPLVAQFGMNLETVPLRTASGLHKRTQEFRLTSRRGDKLEWLAGLYYTNERGSNHQVAASTVPGGAPGPDLLEANLPSTYREIAGYGNLTWKFTPKLSATGGIRVARNSQTYHQASDGLLAGGASTVDGESSDTAKTYMATLGYALTPVSNVYLRAASGYRPGGPNPLIRDLATGLPTAPPTFDHDTLWSYEAGYKADLLDKKLSVEASLFDIRWDKIQQIMAVNGVGVLVNGGKAEIRGAELGLGYRPGREWRLNGSLSWLGAQLTEDAPSLGPDGTRLPNSPRWSASLGLNREFTLKGHPAYVGVTQRLVGQRNSGFDGSTTLPNYSLPGYGVTDLQAGVEMGDYTLSFYARNVFDKRAQLGASTLLAPLGGPVQVTNARPRTIGGNLSVSF